MAVATITEIFAKRYAAMLYLLSTQKGSRFQDKVRREPITSAEEAYFDTLGMTAAQKKTTRHGPTPLVEAEFGRRKVAPEDYEIANPVDNEDKLKMIVDPTSSFALRQADALGQAKDDAIIEAALGTALCGKTGATSKAFQDDSLSINGDGTVTTLGTLAAVAVVVDMTLEKILIMLQIFNQGDVDPDIPKYWAVTPKDVRDMLAIQQIGSADYNTIKVLTLGQVQTYCGFNFFWSNHLTKDAATSTANRTIAWAKDGIILGQAEEIVSRIDERTDLSYTIQVYSKMSMGAVRMEGVKVHECLNKIAE
jgi:hypothetical protein